MAAPPVPWRLGLDMLYPDSKEQPAPLHPITYAVWYDYLAGRNPDLRAEIDAARLRQVPLGDDMVRALYRRHMLEAAADATYRVSDGLRAVMDEVGHSAAQTGDRVSEFSASLQETGGRIASLGMPDSLGPEIDTLLSGTRDTGASLAALSKRLQSATAELEQLRAELDLAKQQATMDSLTGVTNRRGFDESLAAMLLDHAAEDPGPSVLLIDLDHFKRINDQFGHVFGDTVLKSVALAIRSCVKGRDLVARYGGEEFVVLLPATALPGARALAEQIRTTIAAARIRRDDGSLDRARRPGPLPLQARGPQPRHCGRVVADCQVALIAATWRWSVPQQPPSTFSAGSGSRRRR